MCLNQTKFDDFNIKMGNTANFVRFMLIFHFFVPPLKYSFAPFAPPPNFDTSAALEKEQK